MTPITLGVKAKVKAMISALPILTLCPSRTGLLFLEHTRQVQCSHLGAFVPVGMLLPQVPPGPTPTPEAGLLSPPHVKAEPPCCLVLCPASFSPHTFHRRHRLCGFPDLLNVVSLHYNEGSRRAGTVVFTDGSSALNRGDSSVIFK